MTTFMKESRSSVIASQQVRCAGLRISQWHTCLVKCWCQLAWRHFGWNHWSAKSSSSGFLFFEIRFAIISYGDLFLFLSFFTHWYCSTARVALSEIISGHSVCKWFHVDTQVGRDARMQPSFKLKETARVRMLGKGGKTIAIVPLHSDTGRTCWFCCWETTTLGVTRKARTKSPSTWSP